MTLAASRLARTEPAPAVRRGRMVRRVGRAVALATMTMPVLIPPGPGNTAAADVTIAVAVITTFAWLRSERLPVRLPYVLPVGVLMLAGAVAAVHSHAETAVLAVVQDAFCLLWGAAVANAVRQRRDLLHAVLRAWVWSGVAWATLLCAGRIGGVNWLAGISARDGSRASLTFDDPNLAANYFMCAVALVLATSVIRHRVSRWAAVAVILLAIVFTGSNGAAIGLGIIAGVGLTLRVRNRHGAAAALAVVALTGAACVAAAPVVSIQRIQQQASDSVDVLRDSFGRSEESGGTREVLASEGIGLFLKGDLLGVGPGRTKATLRDDAAPYVKEAHNDYIATLVERGAAGGAGLAILVVAVGVRLGRVSQWPQPPDVRALVPRPEFLLALGCAFAVAGIFYEVLHFRHLWAFLGLVAGLDPDRLRRPGRTRWTP